MRVEPAVRTQQRIESPPGARFVVSAVLVTCLLLPFLAFRVLQHCFIENSPMDRVSVALFLFLPTFFFFLHSLRSYSLLPPSFPGVSCFALSLYCTGPPTRTTERGGSRPLATSRAGVTAARGVALETARAAAVVT